MLSDILNACCTLLICLSLQQDEILIRHFCQRKDAISSGMLEKLYEAHPDFINLKDKDGDTPLIHASNGDNTPVAEWLINNGADVNAENWDGRTPIIKCYYGQYGNNEFARFLLEQGAETGGISEYV